ncbi:hypothetical protein HDU76_010312, partial [Blyttiomyces sp. JEL0837]
PLNVRRPSDMSSSFPSPSRTQAPSFAPARRAGGPNTDGSPKEALRSNFQMLEDEVNDIEKWLDVRSAANNKDSHNANVNMNVKNGPPSATSSIDGSRVDPPPTSATFGSSSSASSPRSTTMINDSSLGRPSPRDERPLSINRQVRDELIQGTDRRPSVKDERGYTRRPSDGVFAAHGYNHADMGITPPAAAIMAAMSNAFTEEQQPQMQTQQDGYHNSPSRGVPSLRAEAKAQSPQPISPRISHQRSMQNRRKRQTELELDLSNTVSARIALEERLRMAEEEARKLQVEIDERVQERNAAEEEADDFLVERDAARREVEAQAMEIEALKRREDELLSRVQALEREGEMSGSGDHGGLTVAQREKWEREREEFEREREELEKERASEREGWQRQLEDLERRRDEWERRRQAEREEWERRLDDQRLELERQREIERQEEKEERERRRASREAGLAAERALEEEVRRLRDELDSKERESDMRVREVRNAQGTISYLNEQVDQLMESLKEAQDELAANRGKTQVLSEMAELARDRGGELSPDQAHKFQDDEL